MCEYCEIGKKGDNVQVSKVIAENGATDVCITKLPDGQYLIEAEINHEYCTNRDSYHVEDYSYVFINYCPFCGRKLEKEE